MIDPVETSELLAFVKTVRASSLSGAAAELGVPRTTIGRRLAKLEERLGVRLLRRTTRRLALTDAGVRFFSHAEAVLDRVTVAEESVRADGDALQGTLRVSLPPMPSPSLNAMLTDFARQHPRVRLAVHFSARHVDLVKDGFDVAVRAGTSLEPGLLSRTLARDAMIAVASPAYLEARGTPKTARDLRDHACILGFRRGEHAQTHWPRVDGGQLQVDGAFSSNEVLLLRDAALAGLGIAMLPEHFVMPALVVGRLVRVLPELLGGETRVALVYVERALTSPVLRAFIEATTAWAKENLRAAGEHCDELVTRTPAHKRRKPTRRARPAAR